MARDYSFDIKKNEAQGGGFLLNTTLNNPDETTCSAWKTSSAAKKFAAGLIGKKFVRWEELVEKSHFQTGGRAK